MALAVYLEIGPRRVFAGAIEWPGWCRSGRDEGAAVASLLAYAPRYARIAKAANLPFSPGAEADVVELLKGGSGTDFGVPSVPPTADDQALDDSELGRQSALLEASWDAFDAAWRRAIAGGVELTKGPRGGGRDLPKLEMHILEAEEAYLAGLGSKHPRMPDATIADRLAMIRATALDALTARAHGTPVADPRNTLRPWSPRYFVRRSGWHALDHAWEIEDRS